MLGLGDGRFHRLLLFLEFGAQGGDPGFERLALALQGLAPAPGLVRALQRGIGNAGAGRKRVVATATRWEGNRESGRRPCGRAAYEM
ncbi:MAG: hypothetical protein ACYC0P_10385 [Thiobacillus sp.]